MISTTIPPTAPIAPETPAQRLDLDLIRKYAIPGPRYTSYPAATQFTAEFDSAAAIASIKADNAPCAIPAAKRPLSLYIHLPFCEALCWYCGCNNIITRARESADHYLTDLEREIALTVAHIDHARPVEQLHLGGGTPTFLNPAQLCRLGALLRQHFTFAPDAEISVEIDPRQLTDEQVVALADAVPRWRRGQWQPT